MNELANLYNQLRADNDFSCIAIVGKENARTTYTVNLTWDQLIKVFKPVPYDADSKLLIQRETQASRINGLKNYLVDPYACLPATGAIVENIKTKSIQAGVCLITIPQSAFRYLFDGQARLGGITKRLDLTPEMGNNTLTIKLIKSEGVDKDNQLFADWNGTSLKPNKSICHAMDGRTLINRYTKSIIEQVELLAGRIDFTKASIAQNSSSSKLWTLNQFVTFVQTCTGTTAKSAETLLKDESKQAQWAGFIHKYLTMLCQHPQIGEALDPNSLALTTRTNTIIGTSVWLKSMALTGKIIALHLISQQQKKADWSFMQNISTIDFSKNNPEWLGRAMSYRGKFEDKAFNHKAVAVYLLDTMGIPLPEELETIEEEVLMARAAGLKAKREAQKADAQAQAQANFESQQQSLLIEPACQD